MNRRFALSGIVMGALIVGLLGSGLVAATEDFVPSTDNSAESGTYTSVGQHNLKAANFPCRDGSSDGPFRDSFGDGPLRHVVQSSDSPPGSPRNVNVKLNDPNSPGPADLNLRPHFCFRNDGAQRGALVVSFDVKNNVEVGDCGGGEQVNDPTCGVLDSVPIGGVQNEGELQNVLEITFQPPGTGDRDCPTDTPRFLFKDLVGGGKTLVAALEPEMRCDFRVSFGLRGDDAAKSAAQTDRIEWTISFTLRDPPT